MRKFLRRLFTALFVLAIIVVPSYFYVTRLYTSKFAAFLTLTTILIVPLTSISYILFRLRAREAQLKNLFTLHGILIAYLNSKGENIVSWPGESPEQHHDRLEQIFNSIFETEMRGEYGRFQYFFGVVVASGATFLVLHYLGTSSLGAFLAGTTTTLPTPVQVGLLGAFAWNLWLLLNSYDKLDLPPSTFYWMPFRYIVGIISGLIAIQVVKPPEFANIFALIAAAIPYPTLLEFLRDKIATFKEAHAGQPPIWKIQGMPQDTIDRLATLGIRTTQELAYSDPLMLLFRTNFQPKIVIDWIDQCLAYNYFGEQLGENIYRLRVRGIRGSIELSGLKDNDPALPEIAKILEVTPDELKYFRDKLLNDYQLKLIKTLWEQFQPQQEPTTPVLKSLTPLPATAILSVPLPGASPAASGSKPTSPASPSPAVPKPALPLTPLPAAGKSSEEPVTAATAVNAAAGVTANVPVKPTGGNGEVVVPPDETPGEKNPGSLPTIGGES